MAMAAKKPCGSPGCPVLVTGAARCAVHESARRKASDARRGTSAQRGYGARWQRARIVYLRANPLCVEHQARGKLVDATVVDHIIPHRGDTDLMWDESNWQGLCKPCHDSKTARGG